MIISRTPLRISFLGGGTDYPQWFNEHGGVSLAATIDKYCYVALHNGSISRWFDLPTKSGLGSSSAYTVGLLRACTDCDTETLARVATVWERDKMFGNVGCQDQYICAWGGFRLIKFQEQEITSELINIDTDSLNDNLMLFNTHHYRYGSSVIADQLSKIEDNQERLMAIKAKVEPGIKLCQASDWEGFGHLLDESWQLKRKLSKLISNPEIDAYYKSALRAGSWGGKLLGGGGGGFIIFVAEAKNHNVIKNALKKWTHVPFGFENTGSQIIYKDST